MYENLKGKKLLVIGSEEADLNIVKTAQSLGVYVIAVDGKEKSPTTVAKNVANESWDIDYFETEKICSKCLEKGIDGVITGYSEFRVLAACRIANKLGKDATCLMTVVDSLYDKRSISSEDRETSLNKMIETALESII